MSVSQYQKDQKTYIKQYEAATNKKIAERQAANTKMSNQYVADVNAITDASTKNAVGKVQQEIDKLPTAFQSAYDMNAVQQKINEREVGERMANLGLTNSGLNRTQQTAINIQRSNADAAVTQQKNAVTASLKQQIADLYSQGEISKMKTAADARYQLAQTNQNVYNTYMDNLDSNAASYAADAAKNRATVEAANIEAEAEKNKIKNVISDEKHEQIANMYASYKTPQEAVLWLQNYLTYIASKENYTPGQMQSTFAYITRYRGNPNWKDEDVELVMQQFGIK